MPRWVLSATFAVRRAVTKENFGLIARLSQIEGNDGLFIAIKMARINLAV